MIPLKGLHRPAFLSNILEDVVTSILQSQYKDIHTVEMEPSSVLIVGNDVLK